MALISAFERSGALASTSAPSDPAAEAHRLAGGALGVDADDDAAVCQHLFRGMVLFLAREVPREPLMFVIRCATKKSLHHQAVVSCSNASGRHNL